MQPEQRKQHIFDIGVDRVVSKKEPIIVMGFWSKVNWIELSLGVRDLVAIKFQIILKHVDCLAFWLLGRVDRRNLSSVADILACLSCSLYLYTATIPRLLPKKVLTSHNRIQRRLPHTFKTSELYGCASNHSQATRSP